MTDGRYFEAIARHSPDALLLVSAERGIVFASGRIRELLGYEPEELVGQPLEALVPGDRSVDGAASGQRVVAAVHRSGAEVLVELATNPVDGGLLLASARAATEASTARWEAERALASAHEELRAKVREIEALRAQLEERAVRDPLTGLYNRRYLDETLGRELSRSSRSGSPISVVVLDLDRLKLVNDSAGHAAGDEVLCRLGEVLRSRVRRSDVACRTGGDEFLVLMPGATAPQAARRAEEWRAAFAESLAHATKDIRQVGCSLSAGVADGSRDEAADDLLRRAEQALNAAKESGRDRVIIAA